MQVTIFPVPAGYQPEEAWAEIALLGELHVHRTVWHRLWHRIRHGRTTWAAYVEHG